MDECLFHMHLITDGEHTNMTAVTIDQPMYSLIDKSKTRRTGGGRKTTPISSTTTGDEDETDNGDRMTEYSMPCNILCCLYQFVICRF